MFNNLRDEILKLNSDVSDVANSKRAVALRKKLLGIGLPMAILGFLGVFVCFAAFAIGGMTSGINGPSVVMIAGFVLIIPCALVGSIGAQIAGLGFKILITGYTSNLADEVVGNNCPNCKTSITDNSEFCGNCGAKLQNKCSSCGNVNSAKDKFCKKCGKQL